MYVYVGSVECISKMVTSVTGVRKIVVHYIYIYKHEAIGKNYLFCFIGTCVPKVKMFVHVT